MNPAYTSTLLVNGLKAPRDIVFDPCGRMLAVDKSAGVKVTVTFKDLPCDYIYVVCINTIMRTPV